MIEILLLPANMFMLGMSSAFFVSAWLHTMPAMPATPSKPALPAKPTPTECSRD
jgi:hypothetical protein